MSTPTSDALGQTRVTFINYFAAIFAAIGSLLFGYDSGIIGAVISPNLKHFHQFFDDPSEEILGAIVSVFAGGAFFGALLSGYMGDRIGRKRTIQLGSLIALVGCTLQAAARNAAMLIAGRFIAGMAIGVLSMIVPLYQAEISPPHARGLLTGFTQQGIAFGFFIANWVGYGCQFLDSDAQWQIPLALQNLPALMLLIGMFYLPYSPRWLAKQGRHEEARQVIKRLHGDRVPEAVIDAEHGQIVAQIEYEKANTSSSWRELFNTKPMLHRTLCGILVQVCGQWSGVNVASYFGPTIYQQLGYTGNTILLISGISGVWNITTNLVFITFIIDRIGRRKPLIIGAIAMAVFLAAEAAIGSLFSSGRGNSSAGIAGIAFIFLFNAAFAWSYGPVSWVYQSEVFSMRVRSMGTALSTASNWAMNVVLSQISPIGLGRLGWKFFLIFIVTNIGNALIAYFVFSETKGLTLEEIDEVFGMTSEQALPAATHLQTLDKEGAEEVENVDKKVLA